MPKHDPKPLPFAVTFPYRDYPSQSNRPHCDMCGPFRGRLLRVVGRDEFGEIHRCKGCDNED